MGAGDWYNKRLTITLSRCETIMLADLLLPDQSRFLLTTIQSNDEDIVAEIRSISPQANCPLCGEASHQIRGRYVRRLRDLPWADRTVHIRLAVRKFSCRQPT